MRSSRRFLIQKVGGTLGLALLLGAAAISGRTALADDWPQFRRDAERTAASKDPVRLPLTEIWAIPRMRKELGEKSAWSKFAVWKGSVYYVDLPLNGTRKLKRTLVCADARSGALRWTHSLGGVAGWPLEAHGQLAVSETGLVYIYNTLFRSEALLAGLRNIAIENQLNLTVDTYNALTGAQMRRYIARDGFAEQQLPHDVMTRLYLLHGQSRAAADLQPDDLADLSTEERYSPSDHPAVLLLDIDQPLLPGFLEPRRVVKTNAVELPPEAAGRHTHQTKDIWPRLLMGPMLLRGKELTATGFWDYLFSWDLGPISQNMRVIHPRPEHTDFDHIPITEFGGFPLTSVGRAVVAGSNEGNRFLAVVEPSAGGQRYAWWHRDWIHSLGIPTVSNNLLFLGTGGENADDGIAAVDASTGLDRWSYAPAGFRDEIPSGEQYISWYIWKYTPGQEVVGKDGKRKRAYVKQTLSAGRQSIPRWRTAFAHLTNPGLVAMGDRVYGAAGGRVAALDQRTGQVKWEWPIPVGMRAVSLVAAANHLFVSFASINPASTFGAVCALRLSDGKEAWNSRLPRPAEAGLANGLLFLSSTEMIYTFAPAERTFRLAVDSDHSEEYLPATVNSLTPTEEMRNAEAPPLPTAPTTPATSKPTAAPAPSTSPGRADATVLRLKWGTPLPTLLEQIRHRRETAPYLPLLLSLDWLDPRREAPLGPVLTANGQAEFAQLCGQLAAAARPAWFDLAPEVNIYLARNPTQQTTVLALLRAAGEAVHSAYGSTKVTASCNLEVLTSKYGNTDYQPFGKVPRALKQPTELLPALGEIMDAVGVTSYPQCAYARPENVPGEHFLALRDALQKDLPGKPLLVTQIAVWRNLKLADAAARQAAFVRRTLRACYWLNAPVVAYPEALEEPKAMGASLRITPGKNASGDPEVEWREVLSWKRVAKLSTIVPPFSALPMGGEPGAPGPNDPAAAALATPGQ